jgi:hypothetical protein
MTEETQYDDALESSEPTEEDADLGDGAAGSNAEF